MGRKVGLQKYELKDGPSARFMYEALMQVFSCRLILTVRRLSIFRHASRTTEIQLLSDFVITTANAVYFAQVRQSAKRSDARPSSSCCRDPVKTFTSRSARPMAASWRRSATMAPDTAGALAPMVNRFLVHQSKATTQTASKSVSPNSSLILNLLV